MSLFEDHGVECADHDKAVHFLYSYNTVAFIIIVLAIITSEFWFETFHQILREITGLERPRWFQMLTAAIFFTIVFFLIVYLLFKVPVAASFTL